MVRRVIIFVHQVDSVCRVVDYYAVRMYVDTGITDHVLFPPTSTKTNVVRRVLRALLRSSLSVLVWVPQVSKWSARPLSDYVEQNAVYLSSSS